MFGLGPTELILILVLVMIIFGAGKLPQVFSSLGKGVKEFRDASEAGVETPSGTATTTTTTTQAVAPTTTPNTVAPGATQQEVKREG